MATTSYPVVNIGTLAGEDVNAYVKNVQSSVDLSNGSLIALAGLISGQDEVYSATPVTDVTAEEVLLVHSPEIIEVNGLRVNLTDPTLFVNPADRPARAYHLKVGDTVTYTDDGITGTTVEGQYVVPVNGSYKPAVASDLSGGSLVAYKVVKKTTVAVGPNRKAATKLRVVRGL